MPGHWCAGGCQTLIGGEMVLCSSCSLGLSKYIDENDVIVQRYFARGLADMEPFLARHAEFARRFPESDKEGKT